VTWSPQRHAARRGAARAIGGGLIGMLTASVLLTAAPAPALAVVPLTPDRGPTTGGTTVTVPVPGADSFTALAVGASHTLGIDAEGNIWGWGENLDGQLGDGSLAPVREIPHQSTRNTFFIGIAAGSSSSIGLAAGGALYTWGDDDDGQLGLGAETTDARSPIRVPAVPEVAAIAAGDRFGLALDRDGGLWAWGRNADGQLGLGLAGAPALTPQQVSGAPVFVTIAAGARHVIAIDEQGDLWAWGDDSHGQVGNGVEAGDVLQPERITSGGAFVAVAAGDRHSLAVDADGGLWAWGDDTYGQLGTAGPGAAALVPVSLDLVTAVDSISAGALHSLAITEEGEVLAWGNDGNAQLGNGAGSADVTAPTAIETQRAFIAVQSGPVAYFSAARDDNGDVWTWGSDAFAQLGNGAASAPVDAPVQVTEDSQWVDIAAGGLHTIAIDQDGVLWGWGANSEGSAGTGDGATPVRYPTRITVPARFTDVAAAGLHSLALDDTGTIWGWGRNDDGQVGDGGAPFDVMTPRAISSGVVFTAISAGDFHSAALDSEGNIWTWGLDAYGELGNGPGGVGVVPVPQQITSGVTFTAVELGREAAIALDAAGNIWTWGADTSQRLGNGPEHGPVDVPTQVTSGTRFTAIDMSSFHGVALDSTGRLWSWGDGILVGDGSTPGEYVDVPELSPTTTVFTAVSTRHTATLALDELGRLWAWGRNDDGQLGNGEGDTSVAVPTVSDPDVRLASIDAGTFHSVAIGLDGKSYAWGSGEQSQTGVGPRDDQDPVVSPYRIGGTTTITSIEFDGVAGTALTRLSETRARVVTPAGAPGATTVTVAYLVDGIARPDLQLGERFTFVAPPPSTPDPAPDPEPPVSNPPGSRPPTSSTPISGQPDTALPTDGDAESSPPDNGEAGAERPDETPSTVDVSTGNGAEAGPGVPPWLVPLLVVLVVLLLAAAIMAAAKRRSRR
jgi:alpha-tubulin suppressor-like RCC1 family protein